jgi:hypothetical protein
MELALLELRLRSEGGAVRARRTHGTARTGAATGAAETAGRIANQEGAAGVTVGDTTVDGGRVTAARAAGSISRAISPDRIPRPIGLGVTAGTTDPTSATGSSRPIALQDKFVGKSS